MKNKRNKKIISLIIVILIVIILIFCILQKSNFFQDNLIFFKILNSSNINENSQNDHIFYNNIAEYKEQNNPLFFYVAYNETKFKSINLLDTIDKKTLVKEKIAPGTKGHFEIVLISNRDINYKIIFENLNEKPQNLVFSIKGSDREYNNLNELQQELIGNLEKNKVKRIDVNWRWKYENNLADNLQDTKDGTNLDMYKFNIYTVSY